MLVESRQPRNRIDVPSGVQRREPSPALGVVDGAAVVGVDEREVDELGALVDVGHAGSGELQQLLTEHVDPERRSRRR